VGEHTDYGFLTLLLQSDVGGLQVKAPNGWIDVPPRSDAFVCNIGDMLERLTGGQYRSTPHRVKNNSARSRLSFPLFFDPNFHARVQPLPGLAPAHEEVAAAARERWDAANPHAFEGTYGDYLLSKVAKVFPELFAHAMPAASIGQ
jgi:polar amino acid transport system ATP-binding protein